MIKFGFQSSKYNNLTLEQELQFSDNNKIDFFDVFFDDYHPDDIKNVALPETFTVHLPGGFEKFPQSEQLKYIDFINRCSPKTVTCHFCDFSLESLEFLCRNINNSKLCIENTPPDWNENCSKNYLDFMKAANEFASQKGLKVYATFDTGHAKVAGHEPVSYLKQLIENEIDIFTVHLHDNDGIQDSHRPAGSVYNGINFAAILEILNSINHDIYAVIEHWNNNYNALEYLKSL